MARSIYHVVEEIIKEVPNDENNIVQNLKSIKSSVEYTSPEMIVWWWKYLANFLEEEIGEPKEEWQIKIAKIFNGE